MGRKVSGCFRGDRTRRRNRGGVAKCGGGNMGALRPMRGSHLDCPSSLSHRIVFAVWTVASFGGGEEDTAMPSLWVSDPFDPSLLLFSELRCLSRVSRCVTASPSSVGCWAARSQPFSLLPLLWAFLCATTHPPISCPSPSSGRHRPLAPAHQKNPPTPNPLLLQNPQKVLPNRDRDDKEEPPKLFEE